MTLSSIYIILRRNRIYWELVSPSGVILTTFKEKYEHKALEYANAWVSSWKDWTIRMDYGVRMPTKTYQKDKLPARDN